MEQNICNYHIIAAVPPPVVAASGSQKPAEPEVDEEGELRDSTCIKLHLFFLVYINSSYYE